MTTTQDKDITLQIEKKTVTLEARENASGRFLRIIETVGGFRALVVVPLSGVRDLRDALGKIVEQEGL